MLESCYRDIVKVDETERCYLKSNSSIGDYHPFKRTKNYLIQSAKYESITNSALLFIKSR